MLPASLVDLRGNWCIRMDRIKKIEVHPDNPYFAVYDDKFIIGKSSVDKENYDTLVFSVKHVKHVLIPDFVEIIKKSAFSGCSKLRTVEFSKNSRLRIIENNAFNLSSITRIKLPPHLEQIDDYAFFYSNLHQIEIPKDLKIQEIKSNSFSNTKIKSIRLPSHLKKIEPVAFFGCCQLKIVEFNEDSEIKEVNENDFQKNVILMIPAKLRKEFVINNENNY